MTCNLVSPLDHLRNWIGVPFDRLSNSPDCTLGNNWPSDRLHCHADKVSGANLDLESIKHSQETPHTRSSAILEL